MRLRRSAWLAAGAVGGLVYASRIPATLGTRDQVHAANACASGQSPACKPLSFAHAVSRASCMPSWMREPLPFNLHVSQPPRHTQSVKGQAVRHETHACLFLKADG